MNFYNEYSKIWRKEFCDEPILPESESLKCDAFRNMQEQKAALENLYKAASFEARKIEFHARFLKACCVKLDAAVSLLDNWKKSNTSQMKNPKFNSIIMETPQIIRRKTLPRVLVRLLEEANNITSTRDSNPDNSQLIEPADENGNKNTDKTAESPPKITIASSNTDTNTQPVTTTNSLRDTTNNTTTSLPGIASFSPPLIFSNSPKFSPKLHNPVFIKTEKTTTPMTTSRAAKRPRSRFPTIRNPDIDESSINKINTINNNNYDNHGDDENNNRIGNINNNVEANSSLLEIKKSLKKHLDSNCPSSSSHSSDNFCETNGSVQNKCLENLLNSNSGTSPVPKIVIKFDHNQLEMISRRQREFSASGRSQAFP